MRVPVLASDKDTVLHRRDPRAKWAVFFAFVVLLYVAPTWHWMAALTVAGLLIACLGRASAKLLALLWALQVPNLLGLILIPLALAYFGESAVDLQQHAVGLKLAFAWSAALFVSVSLFSTMRVEELVEGLHGLGLPHVVGFTIGYMFLLLYTSLSDVLRITDAMKVKGVELESRNPAKLTKSLPKVMVPAVFTIVRRANTMMAVLEMRGFSATSRRGRRVDLSFGSADATLVLLAVGVLAVAMLDRLQVLALTG